MKAIPSDVAVSRHEVGDVEATTVYDDAMNIYRQAMPRLRGILRECKPYDEEDLLQETFIKILTHLPQCYGNPVPWACSILLNLIRGRHHEWKKTRMHLGMIGKSNPQPESRWNEMESILPKLMTTLTEKERQAVELAFWEGLKGPEASRLIGVRQNAFRATLHRAMTKLKTSATLTATGD